MSFTHSTTIFPNFSTTCSFKPKKQPPKVFHTTNTSTTPARDRVIDFGKYKGKMLGTLPSTYLKWVSKNLRAGDTRHWASLADQVLQDPVYNDRLEWEFADSALNGNRNSRNSNTSGGESCESSESAVSKLVEISERFGWNNEDKVGWSRVNFELLGTSKSGRIPRIPRMPLLTSSSSSCFGEGKREMGGVEKGKKGDHCSASSESEERRRRERRERLRLKKEKSSSGGGGDDSSGSNGASFINSVGYGGVKFDEKYDDDDDDDQDRTVDINNPFPGRESLLKKVMSRKKW